MYVILNPNAASDYYFVKASFKENNFPFDPSFDSDARPGCIMLFQGCIMSIETDSVALCD